MFQLSLFYDEHNAEDKVVGAIDITCSHCNKDTGLHTKIQQLKELSLNLC